MFVLTVSIVSNDRLHIFLGKTELLGTVQCPFGDALPPNLAVLTIFGAILMCNFLLSLCRRWLSADPFKAPFVH